MTPRTLADLRQALRFGHATSQQLTEAALARAVDAGGEGARVFIRRYRASALAEARASDLLRAEGIERSPLDGLTVSIKDLFDVAGEVTLAGSVVLEDQPPASGSAAVVARLRRAGAVIVGRTNMTEFAYSGLGINPHYGTPKNPWDRATGRIPGGSSSGAAVSVADAMAAAAIGTDTGGSVRIPAALCGLAGFKPTARRVPTAGALPLSTHLDSIGPIAPTVRCCALVDSVLSGDDDPVMEASPLAGLRFAVPTTLAQDGLDDAVAKAFADTLTSLSAAGARLDEIDLPEFAALPSINAKGGFTAAEAWAWHRAHIERGIDRYDPRVVSRILRGKEMTAGEFVDLVKARSAWIGAVEARVRWYDAMLLPTVPAIAPSIAEVTASDEAYFRANGRMLRNPSMINFLDGCALSLPCQSPGSAPVGLMVAGTSGSDRRILAIGIAIEDTLATR